LRFAIIDFAEYGATYMPAMDAKEAGAPD